MSVKQTYIPGGRLTRVYDAQERAAIDPFKKDYMAATSPAGRKIVAQVYILPALFNYWASKGQVIDENEKRIRTDELLSWLRNVWRAKTNAPTIQHARFKLTDVLWWTRQEDVFAEIASIMGLESANTFTPGWFSLRSTAAKNILDRMTDEEKDKLKQEVDQGLPPEVQHKLADDKWYSQFTCVAKERYSEMGLVSISVVAYTGKSGQLVIDIHDEIANILKLPAKSFEDMYEDKAKEMKRTLLEYIKTVRSAGAGSGPERLTIQFDPDGFPITPSPTAWDKISKDDLELLYRTYVTRHYRLACRDRDRQAPFTRIASRPSDFVAAKYLPKGIAFSDPRAMKLEAIIKFFKHTAAREASHGIPEAFRFKSVLSSRIKGDLQPARYLDMDAGSEPEPVTTHRKSRPKVQRKIKQKSTDAVMQPLQHAQYMFDAADGLMVGSNYLPMPQELNIGQLAAQPAFISPASSSTEPPKKDTYLPFPHAYQNSLGLTIEQQLVYDPGLLSLHRLQVVSPIRPSFALDPVLDPALEPAIPPTANALHKTAPVSMLNSTSTPLRKSADTLALEESRKYGVSGKRRQQ